MIRPRLSVGLLALLVLSAPPRAGGPDPGSVPDSFEQAPARLVIAKIVIGNMEYDWTQWGKDAFWTLCRSSHRALLESLETQSPKYAANEPFSDTATVEFTANRKGRTSEVRLTLPFAHRILDRAVVGAARDVTLPPLPPDFPEKQITLSVTFTFTGELDATTLRLLRRMRQEGVFEGPVQPIGSCLPSR